MATALYAHFDELLLFFQFYQLQLCSLCQNSFLVLDLDFFQILRQSSLHWHFDTFGMGPGLCGAGLAQAPSCWVGRPWTGEANAQTSVTTRLFIPFFLACRTYLSASRVIFFNKNEKEKKRVKSGVLVAIEIY